MSFETKPSVLIVPGLRDHVAGHWQTLLERTWSRAVSVPPLERDKLSCAARVAALDEAIAKIDGPVILVAHSAGVMITVHWVQRHTRPVHGALLATPPDFERPLPEGYPAQEVLAANGWLPCPRLRLPFPSIVGASRNDPLAQFDRVREMAAGWGSRFVDLGEVGHLNPAAGYGPWPQAESLIRELV